MEYNPSHGMIQVFIADKDFADRIVFKEKFPDVPIQICIFHALKTFDREITTKKRNITEAEKEVALSILRNMVYCESFEEYSELHQKLINENLPAVTDYFEKNWHTIYREWTLFGTNNYMNFLTRTSNRLESFNQKIKSDSSYSSNLLEFFNNLMVTINITESEKDTKAVKATMKTPLYSEDDDVLEEYKKKMTNFAFVKMVVEYKHRSTLTYLIVDDAMVTKVKNIENVNITTTSKSCECGFWKTMSLPCRHIFKFLEVSDESLFQETLRARRWLRVVYQSCHPATTASIDTSNVTVKTISIKENISIRKIRVRIFIFTFLKIRINFFSLIM